MPSGIPVPDSRRRQITSSRTDTFRTEWQAAGCRHRDPGYRRVNDGMHRQPGRIDQDMPFFALDLFARIPGSGQGPPEGRLRPADRCGPHFFSALDALAIDHCGDGAGWPLSQFTALDVERAMDVIQRSIVVPTIEIAVNRAASRQVLGDIAPLAAGPKDIH